MELGSSEWGWGRGGEREECVFTELNQLLTSTGEGGWMTWDVGDPSVSGGMLTLDIEDPFSL